MRLVNANEMREIDSIVSMEIGIPPLVLMENAGGQVVNYIIKKIGNVDGKKIAVIVGKGNNGGDGLVIARRLSILGAEIKLFLLADPDNFKGSAMVNWQIIENMGLRYHLIDDDHSYYLLRLSLNHCDLVVDAIYGTGFIGETEGAISKTIDIINEMQVPILSVDIPTGVDATTGKVASKTVKATYTVTFAHSKMGLIINPGCEYVGELEVVDISIPQEVVDRVATQKYLITESMVRKLLPYRNSQGYKNTFGHLVTIGGSPGLVGAITLASRSALRSGCGLVTACIPISLADLFDSSVYEIMTKGLAETQERTISAIAWSELKDFIINKQAIIYGPGLGNNTQANGLLVQLLSNIEIPILLDADGLNVLAEDIGIIRHSTSPLVLTPHPGELARLLKISTQDVQNNRLTVVQQAAKDFQAVVVLKGAKTLIADPQGNVFVNPTENDALATAGSGDVLAGIIGSLLAQGAKPIWAAVAGVYIHGKVGEFVSEQKGRMSAIAGDLIEYLPYIFKALEGGTEKNA